MHVLSLRAPQQPKNAMTKTNPPTTIRIVAGEK